MSQADTAGALIGGRCPRFQKEGGLRPHGRQGFHPPLLCGRSRGVPRLSVAALQDEATGEDVDREIPFINAEQVDRLAAHFYAVQGPALDPVARIARVETFFAFVGADIREGGNQAFYSMTEDRVQMPPFVAFREPEAYYATLAHELTHWMRYPKRLDRDFGRERFGDEGYAIEELVSELGAAFVCAAIAFTIDVNRQGCLS